MAAGKKPFNLIYEAEWNDIPCSEYPLTPEKWAAESIRPLVNTQVDTLFYNLCSSDGYVCELESGPILMENFEKLDPAARQVREVFIMSNVTSVTHPLRCDLMERGVNDLGVEVRKLNPQMSATPVLKSVEVSVTYRSYGE